MHKIKPKVSGFKKNHFSIFFGIKQHLQSLDEVTMNMAEYGSWQSQQPANVNFEPIIRRLKSDIFV